MILRQFECQHDVPIINHVVHLHFENKQTINTTTLPLAMKLLCLFQRQGNFQEYA